MFKRSEGMLAGQRSRAEQETLQKKLSSVHIPIPY